MLANAERVIRNALTGHRKTGPVAAETGQRAIGRQDWPEVIKRWQSVLDSKGGNGPVSAYLWLGRGHRALGDLDAAEAVVAQGLARHRNHLDLLVEHAEIAMGQRDWPAAIGRWRLLLEKEGERAPASVYLRLARAHRLSGDVAAASVVIANGSARHPNHAGLAAEHAEVAMTGRDWPEAIKRWQAMLQAQPDTAPASVYARLARAYRIFGDLPAAEAAVQTGLARHRNDVGLAAEYAEIAMAQRRWPEAIKRWQAIVDAGGTQAPASAYVRLARAHRLHGDLPAAEAVSRDGLRRHPRDVELTAEHAEIATAQEDWDEAIARWQAIVDNLGPKAPVSAYVKLARLHRSQGDCTAAESTVQEGLNRHRDNIELAAEHAEIAMAELDWPEAIARWQAILDARGVNAPAHIRRRLQEAERRQAERIALGFSARRPAPNARRFSTSPRWRSRIDAAAPAATGVDREAAPRLGLAEEGGIGKSLTIADDARLLHREADTGWREEVAAPSKGDVFGSFYVHSIWVVADLPQSPDATLVPELTVEIDGAPAGTLNLGELPERPDGSFVFRIPAEYCDDVEHSIAVFVHAEGGFYLRSRQGWTTWPFRRRHKGTIDSFEAGVLHGWVVDHLDPELECEIKLFDGPVELGIFRTAVSRSDVNRSFEVSGRHGFAIPVPTELFDGRKHDLKVFAGDEEIAPLDTPRLLTLLGPAERPEAGARYIGHVDQADCHQVRGWAKDRSSTTPVHVRVEVDGVTVGVARAANFRNRPLADESHGHHGFRLALPRSLMNGQQREVGVFVVEGNVKLAGATNQPVSFPLRALSLPRLSREPLFDLANGVAPAKPVGVPEAANGTAPCAARSRRGDDNRVVVVSAIVLNWNGAELLDRFLDSLAQLALPDLEVVVIDHASEDNSREIIESYSSRLQLNPIYRKGNFSFAESNNLGASEARGEYLLIVNNDIIFVHDCVSPMRSRLDEDPEVGVVGLRLKEPDYQGEARWGLRDHHLGIEFVAESIGKGRYLYQPAEILDLGSLSRDPEPADAPERVAVTAALCMVRKRDFLAIGGFHTGYFYGSEDVDLCLRMREVLGKKTVCVCNFWAIHNRSATRERKIATAQTEANPYQDRARLANRNLLVQRFGPTVLFRTLRETIAGDGKWREAPPRATFIVTAADIHTAAGDYFTAMELGEALRAEFGWDVAFAVMNQHSLAKSDFVVFMRFDYAISEVKDLSPGAVLVAWIRNRVDQWIASGNLEKCHIIFCSSQKAIDAVREATGRQAFLLPIASNTERFRPMPPSPKHKADVVFTGHHWGDERDAVNMLDPSTIDFSLAIYGAGWEKHEWREYSRGVVPYYELPEVYSSANIVIDDSHPVTREWNSLNSRVFDALASGALLLTNCEGGAREIFGDALPTFSWPEELRALITKYLEAPEERKQLAASLHERVCAEHSYRVRAKTLKATVCSELGRSLRIAIKIGIPRHAEKETWGDFHFAHSLRKAFERQGCYARVDILPEWYGGFTAGDDVVIVLRGLSQYEIVPGPLTFMWLISHPDAVALTEMQKFHHVFVASDFYAEKLTSRLGDRVSSLLQCVDPEIFRPDVPGELRDQLVFVGNTRGQRRTMVSWAMEAGLDFRVYGSGWAGRVPAECYGGDYIPNDQLAAYYGNGNIILNDHWPDMGAEGFLSNRLFDAAAVGAKIISDPAQGLNSVFGDRITVCRSAEELKAAAARLRHDDWGEQRRALRDEVLRQHTFDHRAAEILDIARRMIGISPAATMPALSPLPAIAASTYQ